MANLKCTNTDTRYILEFIGCDLVVVQNSETVFKAKELSLCPFMDEICDYCYCKHTVAANGSIEVAGPLDANFLYINIEWPAGVKESEKNAAITLPKFNVTELLPHGADFTDQGLGSYGTHTYPIAELLMLNSKWAYQEYKIHNYTTYDIKVNVLTATHCDTIAESREDDQPDTGTSTPDYVG